MIIDEVELLVARTSVGIVYKSRSKILSAFQK